MLDKAKTFRRLPSVFASGSRSFQSANCSCYRLQHNLLEDVVQLKLLINMRLLAQATHITTASSICSDFCHMASSDWKRREDLPPRMLPPRMEVILPDRDGNY